MYNAGQAMHVPTPVSVIPFGVRQIRHSFLLGAVAHVEARNEGRQSDLFGQGQ
jgi:hypothetical protein